jgi:hypothetical protein
MSATSSRRAGNCVCGAPVADHFDRQNRELGCAVARRRMQQRTVHEIGQLELLLTSLATVKLSQEERPICALGPFMTLTADEQRELRYLAVGAMTALNRAKRRVARARAIARGTEEFRRNTGWRELPLAQQHQMREVLRTALNAYDNALQGLDPITDFEIERELGLDQLPVDSPVRRAVESAQTSEGKVQ